MSKTATITSKGQVTIPRAARKALDTNIIEIKVVKDGVMLKPVRNMAGSLKNHAKKSASFRKVRESVWNQVARAKAKHS